MTQLDWEKARKRKRLTGNQRLRRTFGDDWLRQKALRKFVRERELACFVCQDAHPPTGWAKTGANRRGPWAICRGCVRVGKATSE